jgi:hypothetical protein
VLIFLWLTPRRPSHVLPWIIHKVLIVFLQVLIIVWLTPPHSLHELSKWKHVMPVSGENVYKDIFFSGRFLVWPLVKKYFSWYEVLLLFCRSQPWLSLEGSPTPLVLCESIHKISWNSLFSSSQHKVKKINSNIVIFYAYILLHSKPSIFQLDSCNSVFSQDTPLT